MSAAAERVARSATGTVPHSTRTRIPVWGWVLGSRVLVLLAGAWGGLYETPATGWQRFDAARVSTSLGSVGDLLGAAAVRWDAISYLAIARHGYSSARFAVYFPLYPLLIRLLTPPGGSLIATGMLISLIAFGLGLALTHRLTRWYLGRRPADATVLLIAFSPFSFVFSAIYSTSVVFACAVATFYLAHQGRFVWASVAAAGATLGHVEGIVLSVPLAQMYWTSRGRPRNLRDLWSPSLPALALPIVAIGGFFAYLGLRGWGWLAPITTQNMVNTGRTLVGPVLVVLDTVRDVATQVVQTVHGTTLSSGGVLAPPEQNIFYLLVLAVAVLAIVEVWRALPAEYTMFGALAILLCTSSAVTLEPLKGLDRYLLTVFPVWIGLGAWLDRHRLTHILVPISASLMILYTVDFTRWISVF